MPKSNKGGSILPALVAAGVLATGAKVYEGSVKRKGKTVRGGVRIDNDYNIPLAPSPVDQSYTLLPTETTGTFNPLGNDANLPSISPQQADFKDKQIGGRRKMKKGGAGAVQHTFPYIALNPAHLDGKAPMNTVISGNYLAPTDFAKADFASNQIGGRRRKMKKGGADDGITGAPPAIESEGPVYTDVRVPVEGQLPAESAPVGNQVGGKKMRKMKKRTKKGGDEELATEQQEQQEQQLTVEECNEKLKECQQEVAQLQQTVARQAEDLAAAQTAQQGNSTQTIFSAAEQAMATGGAKKRKGKKVRGGEYDVFSAFNGSPAATEQSLAFNSYDPLPVGPIDSKVASINNSYPYGATVDTAKAVPAYVKVGGAKKSRKMKKGGDGSNANMGLFVESNSVVGAEVPKPFPFVDAKTDPLYGMPVQGGAKKSRKYKGGVNNSKFGYEERPAMADQSNALTTPGNQVAAPSAVAKADQAPLTGGAKKSRKTKKGGEGTIAVQNGEGPAMADQSNALSLFAGRYVATAAAGNIPPADAGTLLHGGAKKSRKMKKTKRGGADERPAIGDSLVAGRPADADGRPSVENPPFPLRQYGADVTTPIGNASQNKAYDALYNANASLYTANSTGMAGGNCGCVAGGAPKKTLKAKIRALAKKLK